MFTALEWPKSSGDLTLGFDAKYRGQGNLQCRHCGLEKDCVIRAILLTYFNWADGIEDCKVYGVGIQKLTDLSIRSDLREYVTDKGLRELKFV